ncbi:MAG: hypothetical protein BWY66_01886 [bacterium ADurb.Bin374]|nr:MAG: hypothetical protein BWY66_01886 [bacterium ADurb.Bin374]
MFLGRIAETSLESFEIGFRKRLDPNAEFTFSLAREKGFEQPGTSKPAPRAQRHPQHIEKRGRRKRLGSSQGQLAACLAFHGFGAGDQSSCLLNLTAEGREIISANQELTRESRIDDHALRPDPIHSG